MNASGVCCDFLRQNICLPEDDVLGDIRSLNVNNWKKVVQVRDRWKEVVERARTLYRV
jgi:hypothetical protein